MPCNHALCKTIIEVHLGHNAWLPIVIINFIYLKYITCYNFHRRKKKDKTCVFADIKVFNIEFSTWGSLCT